MKIIRHNSIGHKEDVYLDILTFPGGEEHVRLNPDDFQDVVKIEILVRLTSSAKLIQLILVVDALRRLVPQATPIELMTPYFPYARQDRVCVEGEAFGVAVMANIVNSLKFDKVTIWDAHSDVTPSLLDNVINVPQIDLLQRCQKLYEPLTTGKLTLVSPDAGATNKTLSIAKTLNTEPDIIQARKVRNPRTGEIVNTEVNGHVKGRRVLITDDICDGGRTFIELAKVLRQQGALEITLYVTHGIFSKGIDVFDGLIDAIYTTDSFRAVNEFKKSNAVQLNIITM